MAFAHASCAHAQHTLTCTFPVPRFRPWTLGIVHFPQPLVPCALLLLLTHPPPLPCGCGRGNPVCGTTPSYRTYFETAWPHLYVLDYVRRASKPNPWAGTLVDPDSIPEAADDDDSDDNDRLIDTDADDSEVDLVDLGAAGSGSLGKPKAKGQGKSKAKGKGKAAAHLFRSALVVHPLCASTVLDCQPARTAKHIGSSFISFIQQFMAAKIHHQAAVASPFLEIIRIKTYVKYEKKKNIQKS